MNPWKNVKLVGGRLWAGQTFQNKYLWNHWIEMRGVRILF